MKQQNVIDMIKEEDKKKSSNLIKKELNISDGFLTSLNYSSMRKLRWTNQLVKIEKFINKKID